MKTLHQAVFSNETELVNQLISNGANVNEPNFDGSTPLHIACRDGLLDMVKILIENGAIIDFKSKVQPSALQLAIISWWNFDIVSYLLEKGANPNFTAGGKYNSPLTTAIERQDVKAIILLLKNGATCMTLDKKQKIYLLNNGNQEILQFITNQGLNINEMDEDGRTALHNASCKGNSSSVKMLLENGVTIQSVDKKGQTPMTSAITNNHVDIVSLLLDKSEAPKDSVLIHAAVISGHCEMVRLFLNKGANIDYQDNDGSTPLVLAIKMGHIEIVELLLDSGANSKVRSFDGSVSIHTAAKLGHYDVLQVLLKFKPNLDIQDYKGSTALMLASMHGHLKTVELLVSEGANLEIKSEFEHVALHFAARHGQYETVKLLIKKGANIDVEDNFSQTPLIWAIDQKHLEIATFLIENGTDVNSKRSPLQIAVLSNQFEIVKHLIKAGSILNAQDNFRDTPLHYAVRNNFQEIAEILLENGADYNIKDCNGNSPLDSAKSLNNIEILKCIAKQLKKEVLQKMPDKTKRMNFTLDDCSVCFDQRSEIHVLYPCGHAKVCEACCFRIAHLSENDSVCPVCRCEVIDYKKVFF